MNPPDDSLDQRLVWRIAWRELLPFIFPSGELMQAIDVQPWAAKFLRREQLAMLHLCKPSGLPGYFQILEPVQVWMGWLLNIAKEHWHLPRPPADYIVDSFTAIRSHPDWIYPHVATTSVRVCDMLEVQWRRGPGQWAKDLPPATWLLKEFATKLNLKMARVWPWFFLGYTADTAYRQLRHVHRGEQQHTLKPPPGAYATVTDNTLLADGHWLYLPSRRHGCREIRIYITSCPTCREMYWQLHVPK